MSFDVGDTKLEIGRRKAKMTTTHPCESCSMPIESGQYCVHCVDEKGNLQVFDTRFERMIAWQKRRTPNATRKELEDATLAYMAKMPAWRDHPRVAAATNRSS
jgi:hypothetical protein